MNINEKKGLLLVLGTAVISGFSIFINKFGVKEFDPYLFTWVKNTFVALMILGIALGSGEINALRKISPRQLLLLLAIGLLGGAVPFLLFFKGLSLTTAANASFIHKSMFVYVAVLATLFLKEKIDRRVLWAGLLLLLGNILFLKILPFGSRAGDLLILLATVLWAIETVLSKKALKTISPRLVAAGRMGFGSIFILIFLLLSGRVSGLSQITLAHVGWLTITGLFLLGYVLTWYAGLRTVRASIATSILLLGAPITALLTLVSSGVSFDLSQWIGFLLLIAGVLVVGRFYELIRPEVSD